MAYRLLALLSTLALAATPGLAMNHGGMQHGNEHGGMQHGGMQHGGADHGSADAAAHVHADFDLGPADEDFDLRFIDAMVPHHEGAVVMAEQALAHSQRPEILALAEEIIETQAEEIEQLETWRREWYPRARSFRYMWHEEMGHMMQMSDDVLAAMRMDVPLGEADPDFDRRFLEAMIPHHEGAVEMADAALERSQRDEMLSLAEAIKTAQATEIAQMRQWLQDWYGQ